MIAALDVHYDEGNSSAVAAAVVFDDWQAAHAPAEYTTQIHPIEPYISGEFFRRELPCLLAVIASIRENIDVFIVDGYVQVKAGPGLGRHLFDSHFGRIPVIGVAKTRFAGAPACEITRGRSLSPLFVSAAGLDPREAAMRISSMHGQYRIPTLIRRVDQLSRGG